MTDTVNDDDFNHLMDLIKELSLKFLDGLDTKYGKPKDDAEDHKRFMMLNSGFAISVATSFILCNFSKEYLLKYTQDMHGFTLQHISENADEIAENTIKLMRKENES